MTINFKAHGRDYALTCDHPLSSYGVPVLLHGNKAYGPWDSINYPVSPGSSAAGVSWMARAVAGLLCDIEPYKSDADAMALVAKFESIPK